MCKRLLSVLAALCLLSTAVPTVLADEEPTVSKIALSADGITASGSYASCTPDKALDENRATYWEGEAMPASLTLDMQGVYVVDHLVFQLPGHWGDRTQTVTISGSVNDLVYTPIVESQALAFVQSDGNEVTVSFSQPVSAQYLRVTFTATTDKGGKPQIAEWDVYGYPDPNAGATIGKLVLTAEQFSATSTDSRYPLTNISDGNVSSFWRGGSKTTSITLNLQGTYMVSAFVLRLPTGWGDRTQTIEVHGSTDGVIYTTLIAAQDYTFVKNDNTVIVSLPDGPHLQFLQLTFTNNTGDSTPQLSEWEVYGYRDPNAGEAIEKITLTADQFSAPSTDGNYSLANITDGNVSSFWRGGSKTTSVTLNLQGTYMVSTFVFKLPTGWSNRTQTIEMRGSTDGAIYTTLIAAQDYAFLTAENNTVVVSVPNGPHLQFLQLVFTNNTGDSAPQLSEWEVYGARDLNANPPIGAISLDAGMITASSILNNNTTYAAEKAIDGNRSSYWEGNTKNATLTLDLQKPYAVNHMFLRLNAGWGTRTQMLTVMGSMDGETYTPLTEEVSCIFQQNAGDALILLPGRPHTRYLRLDFSHNTGSSHPQVAEWEVYGYEAPAKSVTARFVGKNDMVVVEKTVTSAEELIHLRNTVKVPALGGYVCVNWNNSAEDLQAQYDMAEEGAILTVKAVYEVDHAKTYDITVTDAEASQTTGLTFDTCVTVTAAGDTVPTYWVLDGAKVGFGQKRYTFYVSGNNTIQPQYEPIASHAEVVLQQTTASSNGETFNLTVVAQTSVLGANVSEFGVIYAGSVANLTAATNNVKVQSSKRVNQQYMTHLLNVKPDKYRYAVAYMVIDGNMIYSTKAVQFHTNADGTTAMVLKEGWQG